MDERDDSAERYDAMPYEVRPVPLAHPDHLAVLARLHGLDPAPVERCRVLELGCASGMNLLPLALEAPESHFVGVDVSAGQVALGRAAARELGLVNVELVAADLAALPPGALGRADYIICHGVWSWVPDAVRTAILELMRRHLAPHGVAFLSFNTLPGWHALGAVRDSLLRAVPAELAPRARIAHARRLLAVLSASLDARESALEPMLRRELGRAQAASDSYLLHEYLAPINRGEFFGDVARAAAQAGLAYMAHAIPDSMLAHTFPAAVQHEALRSADPIVQQELLDLAQGRRFTSLLLARQDAPLGRELTLERAAGLYVAAACEAADGAFPRVISATGLTLDLEGASAATAAELLAAAPEALPFGQLALRVARRLGCDADPALREALADAVYELYGSGAVRLHTRPPRLAPTVSERPRASAFVRWQLARGEPWVTDQLHRVAVPTEAERQLLARLDGRLTRADLGADDANAAPLLAGLAAQALLEA